MQLLEQGEKQGKGTTIGEMIWRRGEEKPAPARRASDSLNQTGTSRCGRDLGGMRPRENRQQREREDRED